LNHQGRKVDPEKRNRTLGAKEKRKIHEKNGFPQAVNKRKNGNAVSGGGPEN